MVRAILAATLLLAAAAVLAPTASAAPQVEEQCPHVYWQIEPPGWSTYCRAEPGLVQAINSVLGDADTAATCLAGYDPIIHGLGYVVDCTSHL